LAEQLKPLEKYTVFPRFFKFFRIFLCPAAIMRESAGLPDGGAGSGQEKMIGRKERRSASGKVYF